MISKQLCINVQLPQMAGGLDGSALYIDTNQGFSAIRLKGYKYLLYTVNGIFYLLNFINVNKFLFIEMALSMQQRLSLLHTDNVDNSSSAMTWETILDNINYIYCADYLELMASVVQVKDSLQQNRYSTDEKRVNMTHSIIFIDYINSFYLI